MTRFYGVLAPHAALRESIVTKPKTTPPVQLGLFDDDELPAKTSSSKQSSGQLLARVFFVDVTARPKCRGEMKIIEAVTAPPQ